MKNKTLKGLFVAVAAVLATVGGVAYAAIPDGNTIHGCYEKVNGVLRVVGTSSACKPSELAISWNQQGPKGDQGEQGLQGVPGRDGVDGQDGVDGEDGVDGQDGVDGLNGRDGAAGISTATFAGTGSVRVQLAANDVWTMVVSKTLPAGSWAVTATSNMTSRGGTADQVEDTSCELRNGGAFIGGATDRRVIPTLDSVKISLSMNGGAQVLAGGGEVSLWCRTQNARSARDVEVDYAQIMFLQVGGFS